MFHMVDSSLSEVLLELARSHQAVQAAIEHGEVSGLEEMMRHIELLERERNRHMNLLTRPATGYRTSIPARDRVVQLLRLTGAITPSRLLADLSRVRFMEGLDTANLSSLRRDELRRWRSHEEGAVSGAGSRREMGGQHGRVYVVPALSADRFAPVRGSLALSDWPLARRLVAPTSPRIDLLRTVVSLAEKVGEEGAESNLTRVLTKLSLGFVGAGAPAEPKALAALARRELDAIGAADTRERESAAERARTQLDAQAQLFGTQLRPVRGSAARVRRSGSASLPREVS
jgi:hypothetical protein